MPKTMDEKILSGREYRNIPVAAIELKGCKDDEKKEMKVEGYATTFNEQYLLFDMGDYRVFEQIDSNAFADCDMSDVVFQYNHEGRVMARTRNNTMQLAIDGHGLMVTADLSGTDAGRDLYEEIKGGYTDRMSFGFRVEEEKREITEDRANNITKVVRTITKIKKLYDVSAVSIPANDGTEISARNYSDGLIAEIRQELLEREKRNREIEKIKLIMEVY